MRVVHEESVLAAQVRDEGGFTKGGGSKGGAGWTRLEHIGNTFKGPFDGLKVELKNQE